MTVGIGSGDNENLVNGLYTSIDKSNVNHVVFFVSSESKSLVNRIKTKYFEKTDFELDYSIVLIEDIDNFDHVFDKMNEELVKFEKKKCKILIHYTSGTKTMSITAALIATLFKKDLVSVVADRHEDDEKKGQIIFGTETLAYINLYKFYDINLIDNLKNLFNKNSFGSGKLLLNNISESYIDKEAYMKLFSAYYFLDMVNFNLAFENFDNSLFRDKIPELSNQLANNFKALNIIVKEQPKNSKKKDLYILANIINNAKRRASENKYDDAIARLYRSFEFIGQIQLKHVYKIKTNDVDLKILENNLNDKKYLEILKKRKKNNNGKIKFSLYDDFDLLSKYGDELGKYYKSNFNSISGKLNNRNQSILAHGLKYLSKKDYESLLRTVMDVARKLDENIDTYIEETEFPKFYKGGS